MKRTILVIIVGIATWSMPLFAANPNEAAADLLSELPSPQVLRHARNVVVYSSSLLHEPIHKSASELEDAQKEVNKAKQIIPKLRPLIRVGASVFDYPGLLAHGDVSWSASSHEYFLYLGVYLKDDQGRGPYDFRVTFDVKGKIISVSDVGWKS